MGQERKQRSWAWAGVGALSVATLVAAGWAAWPAGRAAHAASRGEASRAEPPRAHDVSSPTAQASVAARQLRPGDSFVYEVESERQIALTSGGDRPSARAGAGGLETALRSTVKGTLSLTVVEVSGEGARVRGELREARYQQLPAGADLTAELSRPFSFTLLKNGQMQGFQFAKGLRLEASSQLKSLATSLQMVSNGATSGSWQVAEQDVSGEYEATYSAEGGRVHKTKTRFFRPRGVGGLATPPRDATFEVKAASDFDVAPSGWPSKLTGQDSLEMTLGAMRSLSKSATRARLVAVEQRPDLLGGSDLSALESETGSDAAYAARAKADADRRLVDGKSFAQLSRDLSSSDTKARNQTQARMRALFRTDPSSIEAARKAILGDELDVNAKKRLTAALGSADSPEAQKALVSVLQSKDAPSFRKMDAAIALAQSKQPTAETEEALKDAMESKDRVVSSTASLAAGAVVKTVGESQQGGDTQDIVNKLVDRLSHASTDAERVVYLKALGNTGDVRALGAIEPFLSSESIEVRATAVYSLRFIKNDVADQDLLSAMASQEVTVRSEAVHALAVRSLSPFAPALEAMSKTDPDESVRMTLLGSLQMRMEDPSDSALCHALVEWSAASDPSDRVRTFAKEVLGEETRPKKMAKAAAPVEND